jgi:hypothetical protein
VGDKLSVTDDRHAAVVYSIAASGLAPPGAAFLFSGNYNACGVSPSCGVGAMAGAAFCLPRVAVRIANLKRTATSGRILWAEHAATSGWMHRSPTH